MDGDRVARVLAGCDVEVVRRDLRRLAAHGGFCGTPPQWAVRLAEATVLADPEAAALQAWPWVAERYRDRLLAVAVDRAAPDALAS